MGSVADDMARRYPPLWRARIRGGTVPTYALALTSAPWRHGCRATPALRRSAHRADKRPPRRRAPVGAHRRRGGGGGGVRSARARAAAPRGPVRRRQRRRVADARARVRDGRRADRVAPAGAPGGLAVRGPGPAAGAQRPLLLVRKLGPLRAGWGGPRARHGRNRLGAGDRAVDGPLAAAVPRWAPALAPLAPSRRHVRPRDRRLRRHGRAAPGPVRRALRPGVQPARRARHARGDGRAQRRLLGADLPRTGTGRSRPRAATARSAR